MSGGPAEQHMYESQDSWNDKLGPLSVWRERERGITIVADETSGRRYEKVAQNAKN